MRGRRAAASEAGPVEERWPLPDGWRWERMGALADYVSRGRSPRYVDHDGVTVINQRCVRWRGIDLAHAKLTDRAASERLDAAQFLKTGDILWNSTGTGTIGRAAVVKKDVAARGVVVDSHITIIRPDPEQALSHWINFWISTHSVQKAVAGTGSTNQVELNRTVVLETPIPVPPLDIQRLIVARIDELFTELDDGEAALASAKADLETYRKSLLKAAVTGELTAEWLAENPAQETGEQFLKRILAERRARWASAGYNASKYQEPEALHSRQLPELPGGWTWAALDQLVSERPRSFQSGPFGSSLLHSEFKPVGKLVIGIDNVQNGWFSPGSQHRITPGKYAELARFKARPRDVLITVMATIGRSCVVPPEIEDAIITKHIYRMTIDQQVAIPEFVELCFRSCPVTLADIHGNVQGQTRPGLNKSILQRVALPVPPLAEQQRILEVIGAWPEAEDLSMTLRATRTDAAALRQSILAAAFRGELVQ